MTVQKNAKGLFEATVDNETYEFTPWGTRQALDGLIELSDICGEFLAKAAGAFSKKDALQSEVTSDVLGDIVGALVKGMSKDKQTTINLIEKLVTQGVSRNTRDVDFGKDFQGDFMHLFKVLKVALEVQYGSFFYAAKDMGLIRGA